MKIDLKATGNRIKEIRKQHNYSMAAFANLVGNSSASTVNNWEKGNNLPKQARLEKIAILGNTTADWLRYGDFNDYIKQLLAKATLKKELTEEQLDQLIADLKKQKITYSQDLKILTLANELFPDLFESSYLVGLSQQPTSLIAEDFTTYHIEKDACYRADILPIIEDLLHDSPQKEINASILFIVFNLLKRAEHSNEFLTIPEILTLLSDVITDDIAYQHTSTSKVVDYTELIKKRTKGKRLSDKTVKKKYVQTKTTLEALLDQFYSEYH
ncbi:hypothetical protein UAY_01968 [Enterococcus moraviensis ATCC BAA-383]|uniref:HTH cro/C1-type domain-containing protein n=1 Tax=Enterococcus moraviensis ATCC BAA-383 TaxID=1158609 RepID=R2T2C6_9ENTE|nr:helix-turn-helix transcriptional regulator [Enterococcus moraviensis]EOH99191.1 hypothetical protein UAY_01968 [Enterococcus moraviensis ATCC BAA-383]EOT72126.1 hypothetical protein I586_01934 [Enterococcus moraviensis ATCC BAA-383]